MLCFFLPPADATHRKLASQAALGKQEEIKVAKSKKPVSKKQDVASADYTKFVTQLKKKIWFAQFKAALALNRELIRLYWDVGKEIVERQEKKTVGVLV